MPQVPAIPYKVGYYYGLTSEPTQGEKFLGVFIRDPLDNTLSTDEIIRHHKELNQQIIIEKIIYL